MSKIEIKLQFPYVVQGQYEHRTAADTHLQYHCARLRSRLMLPLMCMGLWEHSNVIIHLHPGGKEGVQVGRLAVRCK